MTSMECDERVKSMEPVEIVILDEQRDRRAEPWFWSTKSRPAA